MMSVEEDSYDRASSPQAAFAQFLCWKCRKKEVEQRGGGDEDGEKIRPGTQV